MRHPGAVHNRYLHRPARAPRRWCARRTLPKNSRLRMFAGRVRRAHQGIPPTWLRGSASPVAVGRGRDGFDRSHAPAWERSLDAPVSGIVQRHRMLADAFPVDRVGDAVARSMDRRRSAGKAWSAMPVTWGAWRRLGRAGRRLLDSLGGLPGDAGASKHRSHAGAWERSKRGPGRLRSGGIRFVG